MGEVRLEIVTRRKGGSGARVLEGGMSRSHGGERIGSVLSPPMSGLGVGHWLTRTLGKGS